jgi:hypothetical protein
LRAIFDLLETLRGRLRRIPREIADRRVFFPLKPSFRPIFRSTLFALRTRCFHFAFRRALTAALTPPWRLTARCHAESFRRFPPRFFVAPPGLIVASQSILRSYP